MLARSLKIIIGILSTVMTLLVLAYCSLVTLIFDLLITKLVSTSYT